MLSRGESYLRQRSKKKKFWLGREEQLVRKARMIRDSYMTDFSLHVH